ncbi:DSBA oxidoreductase (modular protein) [Syntrophobacter sp. SbD1]|nr:DSBA oxidoreductase (modular protein) [Syntrophobacter sp. SbD1]
MSLRKVETKSDKLELPPVSNASSGRRIALLLISLAGLVISLMSGFQESIPFLKPLCASACKDTVEIHFLHMPIWLLGALFYSATAIFALFRRNMLAWIVGAAAGVEVVLILVLIQLKAPCVFCMANAAIVVLLIAATFRKELFWQEATLALLFFVGFFFWIPFENDLLRATQRAEAHATGADGGGIAAMVGGEVITNQRLDVLLGSKLLEMRREIYRMEMEKLDQVILQMVLDKEAKQQGKTLDNLLEQIAPAAGSATVEDSEVDKYIEDNHERLQAYQGSMPELRDRIKSFLQQQKRSEVIQNYAHALELKYGVRIMVPVPNPPKVKVDTRGCPTLGPSDAPVTVVEFSDYQCPACRSTHEVVKQVRAIYGDKVQWIYKEYPLKIHKDAFKAAEASHCAEDQGKFWQYQESLFTMPDLSPDNLINAAVALGMSRENFSQCLQDSKYKALVEKNTRDAVEAGIDRTPTFMVNGTVFVGGPSLDVFKALIDDEMRKAQPQAQTAGKAQ